MVNTIKIIFSKAIIAFLLSITNSCLIIGFEYSHANFEPYEDHAIYLESNSLELNYEVANTREYTFTLLADENSTIYPTGRVTFRYTLTNSTDNNYHFTVCIFWKEYINELGCDTVTFIGRSSVYLTHSVSLSPGSGLLWIQGTDILVEPIGNEVHPQYFSAILTVGTPFKVVAMYKEDCNFSENRIIGVFCNGSIASCL